MFLAPHWSQDGDKIMTSVQMEMDCLVLSTELSFEGRMIFFHLKERGVQCCSLFLTLTIGTRWRQERRVKR